MGEWKHFPGYKCLLASDGLFEQPRTNGESKGERALFRDSGEEKGCWKFSFIFFLKYNKGKMSIFTFKSKTIQGMISTIIEF